jgi:3-hydroxybutyryl-CoA dehydrogenase
MCPIPVMESIHAQYYGDDRYRPVALARTRLLAGLLGRKSGQGFYNYEQEGGSQDPGLQHRGSPSECSLWWPTAGFAASPGAVASLLPDRRRMDDAQHADLILVSPLGRDLSCTVADLGLDAARTIAVDPVFCGTAGVTLMVSPGTAPETIEIAPALFAECAVPTFVIADSRGYVAPRVVACIVNLACKMAQQGIATPADIDIAVRLGLGYPAGPFEWGERLGAKQVLEVLQGLDAAFGDQRYRPSPRLVRRAQLSLPLSSPDGKGD